MRLPLRASTHSKAAGQEEASRALARIIPTEAGAATYLRYAEGYDALAGQEERLRAMLGGQYRQAAGAIEKGVRANLQN